MFNPASVALKKALPSSHPELLARFLKESRMSKQNLYPDLDHIDLQVRQENLQVRGDPVMLQLSVTPCYALTIHKTQALSIKRAFVNMSMSLAYRCRIVRMFEAHGPWLLGRGVRLRTNVRPDL